MNLVFKVRKRLIREGRSLALPARYEEPFPKSVTASKIAIPARSPASGRAGHLLPHAGESVKTTHIGESDFASARKASSARPSSSGRTVHTCSRSAVWVQKAHLFRPRRGRRRGKRNPGPPHRLAVNLCQFIAPGRTPNLKGFHRRISPGPTRSNFAPELGLAGSLGRQQVRLQKPHAQHTRP